jgi:hypothetical protein
MTLGEWLVRWMYKALTEQAVAELMEVLKEVGSERQHLPS